MKPWHPLQARLHRQLKTRALLPRQSSILIAVSGGQDSLCLAQLLMGLQPHWGWRLAIVHGDHSWRPDSAANAAHVVGLAQQWQLPVWVETAKVPPASEAAARRWRYQTFEALAQQHGYSTIVTGHTASDRAETTLYNLIRGSGLDGLQSLTWTRSLSPTAPHLTLVRPLLAFTRQETGCFCQEQGLPIWTDSSNEDLGFRRNRLRRELLPYIRQHFNPQAERALAQTAEIVTAEVAYLDAETDGWYERAVTPHTQPSAWEMSQSVLHQAPLALRRRLCRRLLQAALNQSPSFDQVEKLSALANSPNGSQTDPFPGGAIAIVRQGSIWLVPSEDDARKLYKTKQLR